MTENKPKSTRGPFRFSKAVMKAFEEQTDLDVTFKCSDGEGKGPIVYYSAFVYLV